MKTITKYKLKKIVFTGVLAAFFSIPATVSNANPNAVETEDPALVQNVIDDEPILADPTIISSGHVDLGPRIIAGEWELLARDDSTLPPTWRDLSALVLHVNEASRVSAPDNADYGFLQANPGDLLYTVPQVQNQDVVWIGWNTQSPQVTTELSRGATLRVHEVSGPGNFFLFLQEGVSGTPNVLWDSTKAMPQELWMEVNTHTHANWVFTAPGIYKFTVEVRAETKSGEIKNDMQVLTVAVGGTEVAEQALAEITATPPTISVTESEKQKTTENDSTDNESDQQEKDKNSSAGILIVVGVASAVLLIGVIIFGIRKNKMVKKARQAISSSNEETGGQNK